MKSSATFYSWLSHQTKQEPSADSDKKILEFSTHYFQSQSKAEEKSFFANWRLTGSLALTTAALVVVLFNTTVNKNSAHPGAVVLSESPEMILNYNDVELMADAYLLSEADWSNIDRK